MTILFTIILISITVFFGFIFHSMRQLIEKTIERSNESVILIAQEFMNRWMANSYAEFSSNGSVTEDMEKPDETVPIEQAQDLLDAMEEGENA